tara:strand:- start:2838 stop:3590 length:753 start_codon:yes stop_codon:yes gene_type:complete
MEESKANLGPNFTVYKLPESNTAVTQTDIDECQRRVIIFAAKSEKTSILGELLVKQLKVTCLAFEPHQMEPCRELVTEHDLVLFDHNDVHADDIVGFIGPLTKARKLTNFALLSTATNSEVEEILKWPTLKGMFHPDDSLSHILKGIEEMFNAGYWLPRDALHKMIELYRREPLVRETAIKLTKREKQILAKLNEGISNLGIAELLHLSNHTVKSHLYNIFKKTGTKNRIQASNWAKENLSEEHYHEKAL